MDNEFNGIVKSLQDLRVFLQTAPSQFKPKDRIIRHALPNGEAISCVRWDNEFFISGTDILRSIIYRFHAFGRNILNRARFEEFVFSDLRSLKTNVRVRLEEGKSDLLEFLHTNGCIRTKKKQRVFYWDAVPHDQLFLDSLERELRRAVIDDATNESHRITIAVKEPALSMQYDPLLKVAHQIPRILSETAPEYMAITKAVFGVPQDNQLPYVMGSPSHQIGLMYQHQEQQHQQHLQQQHQQQFQQQFQQQQQQQQQQHQQHQQHQPQPPASLSNHSGSIHSASSGSTSSGSSGSLRGPQTPFREQDGFYLQPHPQVVQQQPQGAFLPPPQRNPAFQKVHLPSIYDALPPHAYLDLGYMPVPQAKPATAPPCSVSGEEEMQQEQREETPEETPQDDMHIRH